MTNVRPNQASQLNVFDEVDLGATKYAGEDIKFYANYTNSSEYPINTSLSSNANCNITYNVSGGWTTWTQMTHNATSGFYERKHAFSSAGTFNWNVSCRASKYQSKKDTDTVTVSTPLQADLFITGSSITYSANKHSGDSIQINVTVSNTGSQDAANTNVTLYINKTYYDSNTILVRSSSNNITSFTWTAKAGLTILNVSTDPQDQISESNEQNNN